MGKLTAAIGADHDAADEAVDQRSHRPDCMDVVAVIDEERAGAAVNPAAVDE
jgi:hypothetical protein